MNILHMYIAILSLCSAISLSCCDTLIETNIERDKLIAENPIVVVIPSYNNSKWYELNLSSILNQRYANYRIIYVDDCSTDDTYNLVSAYIKEKHAENKVALIHNAVRKGALANTYASIHSCKNHEIIVMVDGDDWLAHDRVLEKINEVYADPKVWLTYGQFKVFPDNRIGECKQITSKIIKNNLYREWDWCSLHLRSFYAGLFKQIKLQDLLFDGTFFDVAGDMAMMFPMLEMSGGNFKFISDVLYMYNCDNPFNDHKKKLLRQMLCDKVVRSRKKYNRLREVPIGEKEYSYEVPILIFSDNRPVQLYAILESIEKYVKKANQIYVLYQVQDKKAEQVYQKINKIFSGIQLIACDGATYKAKTMQVLQQCSNTFILCMHDTVSFKNFIDIHQCIEQLEKTGAYAFYLSLGRNITKNSNLMRTLRLPPLVMLSNNICAWQFNFGEYEWRTPHTFNASIYRRSDLLAQFSEINFESLDTLEKMWDKCFFDFTDVGLCFDESKTTFLSSDNTIHMTL